MTLQGTIAGTKLDKAIPSEKKLIFFKTFLIDLCADTPSLPCHKFGTNHAIKKRHWNVSKILDKDPQQEI